MSTSPDAILSALSPRVRYAENLLKPEIHAAALSPRVRYAEILLRRGDQGGALAVLEQCERVLPLPGKNNWVAAERRGKTKE